MDQKTPADAPRDYERERQELLEVMERAIEPDVMRMVEWAYAYDAESESLEAVATSGGTVDAGQGGS